MVGVLLGEYRKGRLDITSSYALPFEEDEKDPTIWFLDHSYLETMYRMFRRINAKEKVVGWYSTGPKLRESDLDMHELFSNYHPNPVLVIVDVRPENMDIPTSAYLAENEIREVRGRCKLDPGLKVPLVSKVQPNGIYNFFQLEACFLSLHPYSQDGTQREQKTFIHVPCSIEAFEAEEIGVEHLLRDVKDNTVSTLATKVSEKIKSLQGLEQRLKEIKKYMEYVVDGTLPINHEIMGHLQDSFNLLPNLNLEEYVKAFAVKTNDMMLVIYLSSLIRSVLALHNLISNKVVNKEAEREADEKAAGKGKEEKKGSESKDGPPSAKEEPAEEKKK